MFSRIDRAVIACGLLLAGFAGPASAEAPLRTLILTGEGPPGWRKTTPVLRRILADSGRFDVRVCETPSGLTPRTLEGFDLVVDNGSGADSEKVLASFVESGKGLVLAHGSFGGSSAPAVRFLDVTISRPEHPIVSGMKDRFRTADAVPTGLTPLPQAETIATVGDGPGEPVLTASSSGKGRVVRLALGHDPSAMHEPQFRAILARGCEWAATGSVTLPADLAPPRPAPGAVRALLITGGHDHEATFYSLFEGHKDLDRLPVDTAANAFKKDLRDKYDVLILYDFTRDLDDPGKKNLRDYVEGGKGIVVLHHALLNFQTWTWWSEDVVGGRYRLQREGNNPSSGVKNDQEINVTPSGPHPVLAGLAPFHITDEAYKNLYMSPRIKPLLTTDNPTSDVNLAWIGPCETSRVVAIQLGHGHSAFGHPSYRTLVHNAILWASGKPR
jgi:type 1 glutamine amidotransferase